MTTPRLRCSPEWVDFHCHLDLYPDHERLIAECDAKNVATLAVTTTPKAWQRNRELAEKSTHVRVALGLHPQLIAERAGEIELLERYLPEARYVGEVGLDAGPRFYRNIADQERTFRRILSACAEQGNKILSIHSYRATSKVLDNIEEYLPPGTGRVVLHWFTGTVAEARRAADLGCYFSINSEMLRSPKLRAIIRTLPLNRILTESDGPFITIEDVPARPTDVPFVVADLASFRLCDGVKMGNILLSNLQHLVSP